MKTIAAVEKLIIRKDYAGAFQALEALTGEPETRIEALGHRAWLYRSLGKFEEALADYEIIIVENPGDVNAQCLYAETLVLLGDFEKGVSAALDVLNRDAFNVKAAEVLLRCQEAKGSGGKEKTAHSKSGGARAAQVETIEILESEGATFPFSISPEIAGFLYAFIRIIRPRLILEIGCFAGYSSLYIAKALEESGGGHLHTIDLFENYSGYESPIVSGTLDLLEIARGHLVHAELSHRVTFHKGDSSRTVRAVFDSNTPVFDFAFIDGSHSIRGCVKDWNAVYPLVKEGGFIMLHDTIPEECGWMGPHYILEALKAKPGGFTVVAIPTEGDFGIALIQKTLSGNSKAIKLTFKELLREYLFHRCVEKRGEG